MHMIPHITLRNETHIRIEFDRRLKAWGSIEANLGARAQL
jgi:hypothetical protein